MDARFFAIVPAAGHSLRMGRPKLLLPLAGQPLIQHVIAAWRQSHVDQIVVVVRPDDLVLAAAIQRLAQAQQNSRPAIELVVPPTSPPDMKASLQAALKHLEEQHSPAAGDAFLVAPADMPQLSPAIVDRMIEVHGRQRTAKIIAPTIGGTRGHPVLLPWSLTGEVHRLGENEGLNAIVARHPPREIACDDLGAGQQPFFDVDTPEQYRELGGE